MILNKDKPQRNRRASQFHTHSMQLSNRASQISIQSISATTTTTTAITSTTTATARRSK